MLNFCAKLRDVGRASTDVVSMSFVCSVAQSCSTLCDPMDYSLTSPSVHRTLQAKILEWIAISSSIILVLSRMGGLLFKLVI